MYTSINQLFTGNSPVHNLQDHQTASDHSGLVDPNQINKNITVFRITRPAQVCQTVIKITSIEISLIATAKGRPWSLGWKASAALPRVVQLFLTIMTLTQESMLVNWCAGISGPVRCWIHNIMRGHTRLFRIRVLELYCSYFELFYRESTKNGLMEILCHFPMTPPWLRHNRKRDTTEWLRYGLLVNVTILGCSQQHCQQTISHSTHLPWYVLCLFVGRKNQ